MGFRTHAHAFLFYRVPCEGPCTIPPLYLKIAQSLARITPSLSRIFRLPVLHQLRPCPSTSLANFIPSLSNISLAYDVIYRRNEEAHSAPNCVFEVFRWMCKIFTVLGKISLFSSFACGSYTDNLEHELETTKSLEHRHGYLPFSADLYGTGDMLSKKRLNRRWDPDRSIPELTDGLEDVVKQLLQWTGGENGTEVFPHPLPWEYEMSREE